MSDEEMLDPFSAESAPGLALVVQMRIYDVLLGIYNKLDPARAGALMKVHEQGGIVASLPKLILDEED